MNLIAGIDFLKFKPSEIAAAVAVLALCGTLTQVVDNEEAVSVLSQYVQKVKLKMLFFCTFEPKLKTNAQKYILSRHDLYSCSSCFMLEKKLNLS